MATYISCAKQKVQGLESSGVLIQGEMPLEGGALLERYAGQVQMVYLDPPFNTGKQFEMKVRIGEAGYASGTPTIALPAYDDRWPNREAYLLMMRKTLMLAHQLLRKDGTIFLHIDSRMYAHLRLLMDEIFGEHNFLNDIIWAYQSGGRSKAYFPRKHDTILYYAKSRSYYFDLKSVPVARTSARSNHMRRAVDENGRSYRAITSGGKEYRYYDDEPAYPGDVWDDISHLQQKDPQRTGYETQKPLKLLQRIIACSTREGDLVCDLFGGSGTTAAAAAMLGRRFISVDRSALAVSVTQKRLDELSNDVLPQTGYEVKAPCGADDMRVEAEVYPAITSYTVRLIDVCSDEMEALGAKGLDAVDHWAAGFVRGDTFFSCASSHRSKRTPKLDVMLEMPVCAGEPCVMIADIRGNRRFYLPKRRY